MKWLRDLFGWKEKCKPRRSWKWMSEHEKKEIHELYALGYKRKEIALLVGRGYSSVSRVLRQQDGK